MEAPLSKRQDACALEASPHRLSAVPVIWLTGLSGAGKSTIANALAKLLGTQGLSVAVLDGDALRTGLNSDLGFSDADRAENVRRVAHVAKLFADVGTIPIVALISPSRSMRNAARMLFEAGNFFEVFVNAPLEVTEQRDPKGLYRRARAGGLTMFTGIGSSYEEPLQPDLELRTDVLTLAECVDLVAQKVQHLCPHRHCG